MWGIIPAAGRGSRIQPLAFSKELLPVGSRLDGGNERPCAVSEYLVERMIIAGADKLAFVISPGKSDILEYYGAGHGHAAAVYIVQPSAAGLCDAVFRPAPFIRDDEHILVGLPDTVWFPKDALRGLPDGQLSFLLFPVDRPELFDAVVLNREDRVQEIQVKNSNTACRWIWGAFKMPGRIFHELHRIWLERNKSDEFIGSLVNAYLAQGGEAFGVRSGAAYVDVGTFGGYRSAISLLNSSGRSDSFKSTEPPQEAVPDRAELFLRDIADPSRCLAGLHRTAVAIAHPDDETIGCGALLTRLRNVKVVLITDGAPRNGADAHQLGFSSLSAYRDARTGELRSALAIAGVDGPQLIRLGVPDQEVCRSLVATTQGLAYLFKVHNIEIVLTHAFEGGHPDHDGVAFCVHAASRLLGPSAPSLIEMPFYHREGEGMAVQIFCGGEEGVAVELTPSQSAAKRSMMDAHKSQGHVLRAFGTGMERFRAAPKYDFTGLPNGGRVLYELYDWGLKPSEWEPLAKGALRELGLPPWA